MNYHGIIELEALKDRNILKRFKIVRSYKETQLDADPPLWNINIVSTNSKNIDFLLKKLSDSMEKGWYSLVWSHGFVYVIFHKRIFKIKNKNPWDEKEFNEVVKYGISQKIQKKYFDNLRNSMKVV